MARINTRVFFPLITPSFLSGVLCAIITFAILGQASAAYIDENLLFYDYLFGRFGVITLVQTAPESLDVWYRTLVQSYAMYLFIVVTISLLVGLLIYVFLQLIGSVIRELSIIVRAMRSNSPYSHVALQEIIVHDGTRLVSIAGWAVYWAYFTSVAFPSSILILRSGIDAINGSAITGWLLILGSAGLLWLCLHVTVIFARLSFLRLRLFSRG